MALILVVPPSAAVATRDSAAEVVLVFDLLTILGLLLPLQLEHTRAASIAVRGVTWSSLVVRRLAIKNIGGSLAFSGGGLLYMLQLPSLTLPRVRVGLWGPPSLRLFSRGLPPQMFAQVFIHVRVVFSLHGEFDQKIDPTHRRNESGISSRTSPYIFHKSWEEFYPRATDEAL